MIGNGQVVDPLRLRDMLWPGVRFYGKQEEMIYSVKDNYETIVGAGNELGKDYGSAFIILWFFLTRTPCRIVTTSAKDDHLRVLWGEINNFIQTAKYPLDWRKGGPLVVNHHELKRVFTSGEKQGQRCPLSYCIGMVANQDTIAAMQGHHIAETGDGIPRTLFVSDESSSVEDEYRNKADTWAKRILAIGNTWPCNNFFYRAIEGDHARGDPGGDLTDPDNPGRLIRKVIHIAAEDSPNVQLALKQRERGLTPTGDMVIPGVKSWGTYQRNLRTWDEQEKTVKLWGRFYKGKEILLFPPAHLAHAYQIHQLLLERFAKRTARGIGIDPGEGSADTAYAAVDEFGLIEMVSKKTPNTVEIRAFAKAFMRKWGVTESNAYLCCIDRGGGGKQIADDLEAEGWDVRTVPFGETVSPDPRHGRVLVAEKIDTKEEKYAYLNRRAQMYYEASMLLDPDRINSPTSRIGLPAGYGIPRQHAELSRQLRAMPKMYDKEGRIRLPPKNRVGEGNKKEKTITEILGCSPDQADAFVLAVHAMLHESRQSVAGAI